MAAFSNILFDFLSSMATSILLIIPDNKGKIIYDYDVQELEDLPFKIKIETKDKDCYAILSFLNKNNEIISIPKGIMYRIIINKKKNLKEPHSNTFIIAHPQKYAIYYDPKKFETTKKTKIYYIDCSIKKNYQIFNHSNSFIQNLTEEFDDNELVKDY
ncbi:11153_t:CDS:1 [Gigaspora margarita]|uniref:11153_t:CDS:1 n=1 Tax=Gigaspora margarita TaxID=4874 RepID=A0ABN7UAI8_GIGMA|nr:11153_t:CDS:1 [Gigaspora margarita]